jgi:hypothetical protein
MSSSVLSSYRCALQCLTRHVPPQKRRFCWLAAKLSPQTMHFDITIRFCLPAMTMLADGCSTKRQNRLSDDDGGTNASK